MTSNQINYQKMLTDRRTQEEVHRHNVASESETQRHNVTTETENARHNTVMENFNYASLEESARHNRATEGETNRHNLATESIDIDRITETKRHNMVTESQTDKSIAEAIRHNQASESVSWAQVALGRDQLSETSRHNQAQEYLGKVSAKQSQAKIDLAAKQLGHNIALDEKNLLLNIRKQNEVVRHNKEVESDADSMRTLQAAHWGASDGNFLSSAMKLLFSL